MSNLLNEQQSKGISTELLCSQKFIEQGYIVSVPLGNTSRYDLLVDIGQKILKVQCKTAGKKDNNSYVVYTANSQSTMTKRVVKHYDEAQIDFIASIIEGELLIIPVEEIASSKSKIFRTSLPEQGTKSNCNLVENYSLLKQIIPLIAEEE